MTITLEWLNRYRTERYGFTKTQTDALGVPWPLPKSWLCNQVGREISDEMAREFERGRFLPAKIRPLAPDQQRVYDRECACWVPKIIPPPSK